MRHHHCVRAPPQTPSHRRAAHKGATPRLPSPPRASPRLPSPPRASPRLPAARALSRRTRGAGDTCAPLRVQEPRYLQQGRFAQTTLSRRAATSSPGRDGQIWGDIALPPLLRLLFISLHLPTSPHVSPPLLRGRRDACSSRPRAVLGPSPGTQSTFGGRSRRQQPTQSRSTRRLSTSARRSRASGSRVGCPRRAADRGRGGQRGGGG